MASLLRALRSGLEALIAPPACPRCDVELVPPERSLCAACWSGVPRFTTPRCVLCDGAVSGTAACAGCAARGRPIASCLAAAPYREDVAEWIRAWKYPEPGRLASPTVRRALMGLAAPLCDVARIEPPDRIVPVPLHPRRLRERGFNQVNLLAQTIASACGARVETGWLGRVRDTPTQTGLREAERRRNVRGAFVALRHRRLRGARSVWLVDDVVTTGSTLEAAARALVDAGVERVTGACWASAGRSSKGRARELPSSLDGA